MGRPSKKNHILQLICESMNLRREMVAKKVGVTAANIWRAERGKIVSEEVAYKIAEALNISSDIVFYNMGRIPPDKMECVMEDPLFFKELMDDVCADSKRPNKTQKYMVALKENVKDMPPSTKKLLSKIKPTK